MATPTEKTESSAHSLVQMATLLLERRRLLLGLPLLTGLAAVVLSLLLLPRLYTVESRFTPESSAPQMSRLLGLATQFGIEVGAEGDQSVDFYAELLESQELLRSAALTEYVVSERGGRERRDNLVELLEVKGDTEDERIRETVEVVNDLVVARTDVKAGIVSVRVSMPWPELAVHVNRRLLELVNEFNLDRRQSRASAEREFLEARVAEASRDLNAAEDELERFLDENRRYSESPQLSFEYTRLQRRVSLVQEVFRSLVQAYEQARVDEVRNTPVITVLDQPRGPAERTSPAFLLNAVLGVLLGALLALAILSVQELLARARRARPAEFAELEAAARKAMGWLPRRRARAKAKPLVASHTGSEVATRTSSDVGTREATRS